ncbi:MAG: hypothetical protein LKF48_10540 [Prevotella sp.]|jgi:hypothetical protein|nr:hypothetical protein [Prevotella sp.]MCH4183580.1 hypothetical protein [Prevotella sp.]HAT62940.1 hypothetical protein [Prevotella sp.]
MSKIFRLFKEGAETFEDWHSSSAFPYNSTHLQEISDPEGDNSRNEITSIPSPFARIDIAKHAFDEVNKQGMEGTTIYHKTVSDVLDVGEIFFNYDKLSDIVEIIQWNPSRIQQLSSSASKGKRFLGEALETYLTSDKGTYNFDDKQSIYILNYKGKKARHTLDIIGATSPATLFFSSANDLSYLANEISFGTDHPFDKDYCPLFKRDFEYVKAWFVLRKAIPNFASRMPEVSKYLDNTLAKIADNDQRAELIRINGSETSQYGTINTTGNGQSFIVEVFGQAILGKVIKPVDNSDFTIVPTTEIAERPLVLPVEGSNIYKDFLYTQGAFGTEAHAPYVENNPCGKRKLPYDGRTQDYLTISDFLEDYIIRVPHKLNSEHYVNAMTFTETDNAAQGQEVTYLIPLKPKFFEFFRAEDLQNDFQDNKLGLKIDQLTGGVVVTLQIPVKGHARQKVVTYQRRYAGNADLTNNKGGIETFDFDSFVMPLVRDNDESRAFYTIGCISVKSRDYNLKFFKGNKAIDCSSDCRNLNSSEEYKSTTYTVSGTNFDYIAVSNEDGICGVIVPKFKQNLGTSAFHFSIDVGTSNTHIAYQKQGSAKIEDFHYDNGDSPISTVFVPTKRIVAGKEWPAGLAQEEGLIEADYLPVIFGEKSIYGFPTRTDLSCAHSYRPGANNIPFGLFNASMTYDKLNKKDYNDDKTNIKWESDANLLRDYISCLLLMVRNKVLLNDGNLSKTTITWFFPTSMPIKRKNLLKQVWDELFKRYITDNGTTNSLTESSAPVYYLFKSQAATTNMISIDIGGGTTDMAFAKQNKILSVSSFRFASNALFENQLAPDNLNNGIVDYFKNVILQNIEKNDPDGDGQLLNDISKMYEEDSHSNPANMASFLFSLKDNSMLKDLNKDVIDFNEILNKNEDFKIVFILFYTAILYHVAKIIKYKDYELPNIISFSGNGSRLLKVITTNMEDLADYSLMVLKDISGKTTTNKLKIVGLGSNDNPKAVTCYGGLKAQESTLDSDPEVSLRSDGLAEVDKEKGMEEVLHDENYLQMVVDGVKDFFKYALHDLPSIHKYNYDDHFGVTPQSLRIARSCVNGDIRAYLEKGISLHLTEDSEEKLSQTMFFLPIKGVLDDISTSIAESLNEIQ